MSAFCLRLILVCSNSHCWISNESLLNDANGVEISIDFSRFLWRSCGRAMLSPPILRGREKSSPSSWIISLPAMFCMTRPSRSSTLSRTPSMEGVIREEAQLLLNPLRQTCIGILGRGENKLTKSVQTLCI